MNKITNITIDQTNNLISFDLSLTAKLDDNAFILFVDDCHNIQNIYSDNSSNHCYYFDSSNSDITVTDNDDFNYFIEIENTEIANMTNHMKYFKVLAGENNYVSEGVFYQDAIIYDAELTRLKKVCNMCLDNQCMQLIMLVVFKRQLLESALQTNDCHQCMSLYIDLCKLLDVCINESYDINSCNDCDTHSNCAACCNDCCLI